MKTIGVLSVLIFLLILFVSSIYAETEPNIAEWELKESQLQIGDRISRDLLWRIAPKMAGELGDQEEAVILNKWRYGDAEFMMLRAIDIEEKGRRITEQEFYQRALKALEGR